MNGCMICFLQCKGNRSTDTAPNGTEINLANRDTFCCTSTHKDLVSDIKLIARYGLLDHLVLHIGCNSNETIAGNSFQNSSSRGGMKLFTANDENILTSTFSDISLRIQHNSLIESQADRLSFCQHAIGII